MFYSACGKAELSIALCFCTGICHNSVFLSSFGDERGSCSMRTIVERENCSFGTWDSFSVSNFHF